MGVTSSFFNKKQRASYGNSTSGENRNKGSMGMYGGNGDDDQGDDNGTSSTNTNSTTTNADGNTAKTEVTPKIPLPERVKYADLSDIANTVRELGYIVETEADKKKREEAERKKKLRTSISDGLSALASAFFVNAGGLPTYDPKDNAYNRLKAELKEGDVKREKQRAEWLAAMERAVARNREDVNAENAHNWKEYGAKVDEARYKEGMDLKREEMEAAKEGRAFDREMKTKDLEHRITNDKRNYDLAVERLRKDTANKKSVTEDKKQRAALMAAWNVMVEEAKNNNEIADLMRQAGTPVVSKGYAGAEVVTYRPPTLDQMIPVIAYSKNAMQAYTDALSGKKTDDGLGWGANKKTETETDW
jgi:hypothetical protein